MKVDLLFKNRTFSSNQCRVEFRNVCVWGGGKGWGVLGGRDILLTFWEGYPRIDGGVFISSLTLKTLEF